MERGKLSPSIWNANELFNATKATKNAIIRKEERMHLG